jgi:NADPH2:quinone reductase
MTFKTKAIVCNGTGGPEVLEQAEIALPWPGAAGEVLVRLKAAALNPADGFFRALGPYIQSEAPLVLGHDGAGVVEEVGAGVKRFKPGDRVCFCNGGIGGHPGTYAEFAVVPESQLVAIPKRVDFHSAAALPLVTITCWEALYERADLQAGEHVLVHGGAGGTGHMAIQLAALCGAKVAATVSSDAKAEFVIGLGADKSIFYRDRDFVEEAMGWTRGRGLDVALDNVGAEAMQNTFRAMAPYGRVVTLMGTPADDADETAYVQNLTIHNVMMLTPMILGLADRLAAQARIVDHGMALLAKGNMKIHIADRFDLADMPAAHAKLEAGGSMGKIVIHIAD